MPEVRWRRARERPGKTDDARGTRIQNGGVAASPFGRRGGVGPGGIGSYQITAPPDVLDAGVPPPASFGRGHKAIIEAGVRYVYERIGVLVRAQKR